MKSNHDYNKKLQPFANRLRKRMTKSEACLWKYVLKAGQVYGYTFRRQRSIGPYIADFACLELNLVIETDGYTHLIEETQIKDQRKEKYLHSLGYTVLRFKDEEVLTAINLVREEIERTVDRLAILHPRLPGTPASGGQPPTGLL